MRLTKLSALVAVFLWTISIPAARVLADGNDATKLQELAVKSGFQKLIEQLPKSVTSLFEGRLAKDKNIPAEKAAIVRQVVAQTLNVPQMSGDARKDLDHGLDPQETDAILAWLNSSLGSKIAQLEESAYSGADLYAQMAAMKTKIADNPPAPARLEILHKLDDASQQARLKTQMKVEVLKLMGKFSDLVLGLPVSSDDTLRELVGKKMTQLETKGKEEAFLQGLVVYQSLTDEELLQYVNFYQTPAGKKYVDTLVRTELKVLGEALRTLGDQLVKQWTFPKTSS